jgi:hypothetical protein
LSRARSQTVIVDEEMVAVVQIASTLELQIEEVQAHIP